MKCSVCGLWDDCPEFCGVILKFLCASVCHQLVSKEDSTCQAYTVST